MKDYIFPSDFEWGTATASYQVEGAWNEDGKGENIWDKFTHQPGNILDKSTGDTGCNHYTHYRGDVKLMKEIGLTSYRFSLSWARIFPEGYGRPNPKGIDFYKRLADELLEAGIKPAVTLYHWDLPQALQDRGGWVNRDTVNYFEEYANFVYGELGQKVPLWITHNEPWVAAFLGNYIGDHAPGYKDLKQAVAVSHNLLLSHGKAVKAFRESGLKGKIGITCNLHPVVPATESVKDIFSAKMYDEYMNKWFLDPVLKGEYPELLLDFYIRKFGVPEIKDGDKKIISEPVDFIGVNYYFRIISEATQKNEMGFRQASVKDAEYTEMGWEVYPQGLYNLLKRLKNDYGDIPLYITENGSAFGDEITEDKKIHDTKRIEYLKAHFIKAHEAIRDGVQLKGYYVWSLMDNFEWALGYSKRFGLIYVDYETQKRYLKDSASFYNKVIQNNGIKV